MKGYEVQTLKKSIANLWLSYHKISHIGGDTSWLYDNPTIKYVKKGFNELNIPFGETYLQHISQKYCEKKSNMLTDDESVEVVFLVEYTKHTKKYYKVFHSQNHVQWYITHDNKIVDNKKYYWFDSLPTNSKILAYKYECLDIVSDTFLMDTFYSLEDFLSTEEKKHLSTLSQYNTSNENGVCKTTNSFKAISTDMIKRVFQMAFDAKMILPTIK